MGYHIRKIKKGTVGEFSKILEEFEELQDSFEQANKVLQILEMSDLVGAIEAYSSSKFNITIKDLVKMKNTKASSENGDKE